MTGISIEQLSVSYGSTTALDRVDLDIGSGDWVGVIGPNGAGKSTLIKAIAGSVAYRGSIAIDGLERRRISQRSAGRMMAVVPQDPVVPPGMSVFDYVLLGRTPHLGYLAVEGPSDRNVVHDVLEVLDTQELANRSVGSLSGGERQRVVLARALAQDPQVLLLDEPTTALDIGHQQQVLDLVDGLRQARSITVVSAIHDLTLAAQYTDRLEVFVKGGIVESGPPKAVLSEALLAHFSGARVEILTSADGSPVVVPKRGDHA